MPIVLGGLLVLAASVGATATPDERIGPAEPLVTWEEVAEVPELAADSAVAAARRVLGASDADSLIPVPALVADASQLGEPVTRGVVWLVSGTLRAALSDDVRYGAPARVVVDGSDGHCLMVFTESRAEWVLPARIDDPRDEPRSPTDRAALLGYTLATATETPHRASASDALRQAWNGGASPHRAGQIVMKPMGVEMKGQHQWASSSIAPPGTRRLVWAVLARGLRMPFPSGPEPTGPMSRPANPYMSGLLVLVDDARAEAICGIGLP